MARSTLLIVSAILLTACGSKQASAPQTTPSPATPAVEVFRDVAAETGLAFQHASGASGKFLMPEIMGAGVALFDMDDDGDLDVLAVQSKGASQLFRNELIPGGQLRFTNVTAESGVRYTGYGMGAASADVDGDGLPDLLITGWGSTALYRNLGKGKFAELPFPQSGAWSTSASFFDYDRDGKLDVIVLSYVAFTEAGNKTCYAATGEPDYCTPKAYSPVSARLYRNTGGGKFADVTAQAGIDRALGPGLGVVAFDLNDDGWQDLFVANDTAQNHVWLNQKDGTFREAGIESGAAYSEDGLAKAGMGVSAGDFDGDGDEDLFVLNLMREGATLFRKESVSPQGWPIFLDVSRASGLYQITFPYTGFGTSWFDYDNDGRLDLFLANGAVTLREEQRGQQSPFKEKNLLIRNLGNGKFEDITARSGAAMQLLEISRGAAFGDIDNDGDTDIAVTNNNGPLRLLRNDMPKTGWVDVRLEGRAADGALVTLYREDLMPMIRRAHTDSSYCSTSDPRVHFGLGDKAVIGTIEVLWPDGKREAWASPAANRVVRLRRGTGQAR